MEIRSGIGIERKPHYPIFTRLGAILGRAAEIRLPTLKETIHADMFASDCLPYEAINTYRSIMVEYDRRRAQTLVEARRHLSRVL